MMVSLDAKGGGSQVASGRQHCVRGSGWRKREGQQGGGCNSHVEKLDEGIVAPLKIYVGKKKGCRK